MRLLVTGMNGTVAPRLAEHARRAGHDVVAWDREAVSPDDPEACRRFIEAVAADGVAHLAFGAESWAGLLAQQSGARGVPFVFTSTPMVFAQRPNGPYPPSAPRNATDDYGRYKIRCEDEVRRADPDAMTVQIAYQIDPDGVGNNLVAHLDAQAADGEIRASTRWVPACAFLDDTAAALLSFLTDPEPGVHHLDANAETAWTYHHIVTALRDELGRGWRIAPRDEPDHDQRLAESHRMPGLDTRLRPPA